MMNEVIYALDTFTKLNQDICRLIGLLSVRLSKTIGPMIEFQKIYMKFIYESLESLHEASKRFTEYITSIVREANQSYSARITYDLTRVIELPGICEQMVNSPPTAPPFDVKMELYLILSLIYLNQDIFPFLLKSARDVIVAYLISKLLGIS